MENSFSFPDCKFMVAFPIYLVIVSHSKAAVTIGTKLVPFPIQNVPWLVSPSNTVPHLQPHLCWILQQNSTN